MPDFDRWINIAEKEKVRFFQWLDDHRSEAKPMSQKFDEMTYDNYVYFVMVVVFSMKILVLTINKTGRLFFINEI